MLHEDERCVVFAVLLGFSSLPALFTSSCYQPSHAMASCSNVLCPKLLKAVMHNSCPWMKTSARKLSGSWHPDCFVRSPVKTVIIQASAEPFIFPIWMGIRWWDSEIWEQLHFQIPCQAFDQVGWENNGKLLTTGDVLKSGKNAF